MIRLVVRCRPEAADAVLAELLELAPSGVEERAADGFTEYAIYGAPGELPEMEDVKAAAGEALVEVRSSEVGDDWAERWRRFHKPVSIGKRLRVRAPWEPPRRAHPSLIEIVIDPGHAFGTGAHPTTRLCLELLIELAEAGKAKGPLMDWGTGSGVLAVAARKLGWRPVAACDSEAAALQDAAANARANRVELELRRVDLRREPPPVAPAVTANLTAELLLAIAGRLAGGGSPAPDLVVCSGLLAGEADEVARAFAAAGLWERGRRDEGGWSALHLARA